MHKVLIRPLEVKDAETSWKWRNVPEVWEMTGSKPSSEITYEIELNWITNVLKDKSTKRFAILVDDVYVGNIQLTDIKKHESAQYHIFIGDVSYWGKGIAKLASSQILYYSKEVLKLEKIFLKVRHDNIAAIKVYLKSGFVVVANEEGWVEMNYILKDLIKPIVSIFVMVYNHEIYLKECLDSLLMQHCNFNFDIVVGEDCSTDKSREILINYQTRFPGKFKLLLHEKNIGAHKNQEVVYKNCTGKFIVLCEGDDYWTDPLKLQKQVDFLEANEEYGLVHTDVNHLFDKSGKIIVDFRKTNKLEGINGYVYDELLKSNHISTLTVMFKRSLLEYYYSLNKTEISNFLMGDYVLWLEFSQHCKFHYIPETTATYRVLENSGSNHDSYYKKMLFLNSYYDIKLFFLNKYPSVFITEKKIELMRLVASFFTAISCKEYKASILIISGVKFETYLYVMKIYYNKIIKYIGF